MSSVRRRRAPVDRTLTRHLRRVPMFPLPEVVLFPHALLPLHVFEERYRKMTRDALASNKLIVMGHRLEAEIDGEPPPRVARVAGIGEVVMAQELPDGRFNLVLKGRARVHIQEELVTDEPYRVVVAREIPDELPADAADLVEADASLRALIGGLADAIPDGGALLKQVAAAQDTPVALVNVVAAALVADPRVRQSLLETIDVLQRIERVSSEVVSTTARVGPDDHRGN